MMRIPALSGILACLLCVPLAFAQKPGELSGTPSTPAGSAAEEGIPVTDPLTIAKCEPCHRRDERGDMQRISWERTTPEGWQEALKKMILKERIALTAEEARSIVRYLSASHGLAPEEARPVLYYPERRIPEETGIDGTLNRDCTRCHAAARALSWRRSLEDWRQLADAHAAEYKVKDSDEAIGLLARTAPLHTAAWASWSSRARAANLAGRWLVTAHVPGRGQYVGEMQVAPDAATDEFATRVTLHSVRDGSVIARAGQSLVYGGYAWRGRSRGATAAASAPDDPSSEAREVLWIAPDQRTAEGRWFWGQYQEFGFDVTLQRPSGGPMLLAVDRPALKAGSRGNRIRLMGDHFPARVSPADLDLGPGVTVRRVISATPGEIVAEADVAAGATPGKRDAAFRGSVLKGAVAIYDRIDYLKVTPESSLAAFGSQKFSRGFQQFEAIAYQRADSKERTAPDLDLGPVDAVWSMEVFYAVDSSRNGIVGRVSPAGMFIPAADNPGTNYDVWVIATAVNEKNLKGEPLTGKAYLVVTVPEYTLNGRHYVRDLNRWIEEGTW